MHHHEQADGSGYPSGIKKNDIHPFALICGIADVYDALTSKRLYRTDQNKPVAAIKIIMDEMLPHFGSQLLTKFVFTVQKIKIDVNHQNPGLTSLASHHT